MSGRGSAAGQQSWQWSVPLNDYFWYDASNRRYLLYNGGNYIPYGGQPTGQGAQIPPSRDSPRTTRTYTSPLTAASGSSPRQEPQYSLQGGQGPVRDTLSPGQLSVRPDASQENTRRRSSIVSSPGLSAVSRQSSRYSPTAPPFAPGSSPASPPHNSFNNAFAGMNMGSYGPEQMNRASGFIPQPGGHFVDNNTYVAVRPKPLALTDPTLEQSGLKAHMQLSGTDKEAERLYPTFKRRLNPKDFFKVGKVFMILWSEPAGESANEKTLITDEVPSIQAGRFGERVFSKVRRFIIIRSSDKYCSALSIVSYGKQGVSKPGVKKSEHGIVYIGEPEPQPLPEEYPTRDEGGGMFPLAVKIDPDPGEKLTPQSRINYGKIYTVEHNVKVKSVGYVSKSSYRALQYQFQQAWGLGVSSGSDIRMTSVPQQVQPSSSGTTPTTTSSQYSSAVAHLMQYQRLSREQAERILKSKGKARAEDQNLEDDENDDSSDNEASDKEVSGDAYWEKTIRHMQKASNCTREHAIAFLQKQRRRSTQIGEAGQQEDSSSSEEETGASRKQYSGKAHSTSKSRRQYAPQSQQVDDKKFAATVATLQAQGLSYKEAHRSVQQRAIRGSQQVKRNVAQSNNIPRSSPNDKRRDERDDGSQESEDTSQDSDGDSEE